MQEHTDEPMNNIEELFYSGYESGVYVPRYTLRLEELRAQAEPEHIYVAHVDGAELHTKADFLAAMAREFQFPDYFGMNWDALEECLTDLEWLPASGYVLVYDDCDQFGERDEDAWRTSLNILHAAANYWESAGRHFFVLLRYKGFGDGDERAALEAEQLQAGPEEQEREQTTQNQQQHKQDHTG